jgi:hypothetical protein
MIAARTVVTFGKQVDTTDDSFLDVRPMQAAFTPALYYPTAPNGLLWRDFDNC